MPLYSIFYLFCIAFELNCLNFSSFNQEINEFTRKYTNLLNPQNFSYGYEKSTEVWIQRKYNLHTK